MVDPLTAGVLVQLASGLAMLVLGVGLIAVTPRRPYALSFGLFLACWAGAIVAGNTSTLTIEVDAVGDARTWILVHASFLVVAYLPLAYFTLRSRLEPETGINLPWAAGLVAPAVAGGAMMLADPSLLHTGFQGGAATTLSSWGPAYPLYTLLFWAAMYGAILQLHHTRRRADTWIDRRRATYILGALLILQLFEATDTISLYGGQALAGGGLGTAGGTFLVASIVGLPLLAYPAWDLATQNRGDDISGRTWCLVLATAVGFGVLSGVSRTVDAIPPVLTLGLWRLGAVALLVHGILRFELFGVASRRADWVGAAGLLGLGLALVLGVASILQRALGSTLLTFGLLQTVIVGGFLAVLYADPSLVDRAALLWRRREAAASAPPRALEVYEVYLARRLEEQLTETELDGIRKELDIDQDEHTALTKLAKGIDPVRRAQPIEPGVTLDERYVIRERIGTGARSAVHRTTDLYEDRDVAVKILDADWEDPASALRRFLWESRVAREIDHPNLVKLLGVGVATGRPYLVLELAEDGTLAQRLEREGPLSPLEAVRVVDGVLAGLAHLHARGLVHGDLKPTNILLGEGGAPRLADLGSARRWEPDQTQAVDEQPLEVGTPLYMSPELARGLPPTPRSDLYAVGAILYETLAGEHYLGLEGAARDRAFQAIQVRQPSFPEGEFPPGFVDVCRRALAKEASRRYPSAGAMREALLDAVESYPRAKPPPAEEG